MNWAIVGGTVGVIVGTFLVVFTKDKKSKMDMEHSYVKVTFDKNNKKFIYDLNGEDLKWN